MVFFLNLLSVGCGHSCSMVFVEVVDAAVR